MAFWKNFGFITHTAIEEILDKQSFTLEELLNESELLQEVKAQNGRLLDFLSKPEQLEKLLEYIVHPPSTNPNDESKLAIYPWNVVACEILCSDSSQMINSFFEHTSILDRILEILSNESNGSSTEIDNNRDIMIAILSRVLVFYLSKDPSSIISSMMKRSDMVDTFISHIDNKDVIEVLLKIIEENTPESSPWLQQHNLIGRLVDKLHPSIDSGIHENVAFTLERIVDVSALTGEKTLLVEELEKTEVIEKILEYAFQSGQSQNSSLLFGLSVIIKLLSVPHFHFSKDGEVSVPTLPVHDVCARYIDKFLSFLEFGKPDIQPLQTTAGPIEPFGFVRMKIFQLLLALFASYNKKICDLLVEKQVLKNVIDIFFYFQWNNFLHTKVHWLVKIILEGPYEELKRSLLIDSQMTQRMIEAHEGNLKEINENKKIPRKGYLGFLIEIMYLIWKMQKVDTSPIYKEIENTPEWKRYFEENKTIYEDIDQNKKLGKTPISQSVSEEEDDDDCLNPSDMYDNDAYEDADYDMSDSDQEEEEEGDSEPDLELE